MREVIEKDPVISNGLARGLINSHALARYIQVERRTNLNLEALVSAIRRYSVRETQTKRQTIGKLITKLRMKNKIVCVEIQNGPDISEGIARFWEKVDTFKGDSFGLAASINRLILVIDSKNLDKLTEIISKRNILQITQNLAEVSVNMSEEYRAMPGVVATIAHEIALLGVNIVTTVDAVPELEIVVDRKDLLKTYQAMEILCGD